MTWIFIHNQPSDRTEPFSLYILHFALVASGIRRGGQSQFPVLHWAGQTSARRASTADPPWTTSPVFPHKVSQVIWEKNTHKISNFKWPNLSLKHINWLTLGTGRPGAKHPMRAVWPSMRRWSWGSSSNAGSAATKRQHTMRIMPN